ncbi:VOC family protein [Paenibacillus lutrae]|uniref:Glyoxalase n=1 Tax=Paenibacillus lutrae TaxID=2078573 RepID=A0A7X3FFU1_9BACL|nr:VOC family protein [Paenibacillus lutrae]MVO98995.1 glyoxalase [Paenibacillus lutrae]
MPVIHPETHIGYVQIKVSHLAESVAFYRDVIGLKVLGQNASTAEMSADGKSPLVILEEVPGAVRIPERSAAGLYHFAILLPSRKELGFALRHLAEHRVPIGQGDHLVSEALYLNDPDGNGIEIYADRPRDTWQKDKSGHYIMATDPVDWESLLALAGDEAWSGMPAGAVIGHVHFHVGDLKEAERFYCELLGFEITLRFGPSALFIAAGGYHHHIGLNTWAGSGVRPAPANGTGLRWFTLVLPDEGELKRVIGLLQQNGIVVEERPDGFFVQDPWQIGIVLTV